LRKEIVIFLTIGCWHLKGRRLILGIKGKSARETGTACMGLKIFGVIIQKFEFLIFGQGAGFSRT
jgi:hypothetical protein